MTAEEAPVTTSQIDERAALASTPLAAAMREGSQAEHEAAEHSPFFEELLGGRVGEAGYAAYLQRLLPVYEALEETARARRDDAAVAAVYDPALERLDRLRADLEHWAPGAGPVDSPAATAYASRVREAADEWAPLFVAHHYTRYLGDLSGGQAIGRLMTRHFELEPGVGVAFYDFPEIPKPKLFKDAYRARLDALGLSEDEIARVVVEVRRAFNLNQAVFVELGEQLEAFRR
ncbi:MAG: biliverdin-producing heme oxygenase [Nocardioides sp.]|uniref:biliverdin-producing heme oxygenase n=1 Tax=Nocardioides sp. TaxID=35761 RepID=UPI0039E5C49D